ncbi:radical SAM protein [Endozoicomonas arenosclerae]|uniref:radical SAM protein n=1 Tax=Endozoicomonas arenosclerae TaxID=1633495 RepID=UPI0012946FDF|nr:radical SAM protein [Endozoicomonas arenosclerae]
MSTKAYEELLRNIHEVVHIIIRDERLDDQQRKTFQQCLEHDTAFYRQQSELYRSVYPEDVPILPPDRYRDLVVQPLIGCPNRACTFCAFYKDKPFRVLTEQQWQMHLSGIERLAGALPGDRDGVFIGSANAMALSQRRLVACLDSIEQKLGLLKRGIAAFSDPDYSVQRSQTQWQTLSEKGLVQLVVGLETGWGELRGKLGKAADLSKVYRAVKDYQSAGISVGLTVLAGVGEVENAEEHRAETCRWIEALNLGRSDKVYVSPLSENGHSSEFALREAERFQDDLSEHSEAKVIPYQMQRFHYYC